MKRTPHTEAPGLVFMTGHNCAAYIPDAFASLASQQDPSFEVLFVDDASVDETARVAREWLGRYFPRRHVVVSSPERKGKARHAFEQLKGRRQHSFVAILDADDRLVDDRILADFTEAYRQGYDVVWANYRTDTGLVGGNGPLDPTRSPRGQGWKTSHFFSFRQELIENVPREYFLDDTGQWFQCACDFAIAYPLLDQTRRYLHIPRTSYRYTTTNPCSHHQQGSGGLSSPLQRAAARQVLAKPPLALSRDLQSHLPSVVQALSARLQQTQEDVARCRQSLQSMEQRLLDLPFQMLAVQRLTEQERIPASWLREAGGWALDIGLLAHLADLLDDYACPRVLEFGSGRGTKSLARMVANRGGTLTSIEHDPEWFQRTSAELQLHGLSPQARVEHRPLVDMDFCGIPGRFYDMQFLQDDDVFDVVIVDGPPAKTIALARLPALPSIATHLSAGGFHILLDDHDREDEQTILKMWLQLAPELTATSLRFGKGVAQLQSPPTDATGSPATAAAAASATQASASAKAKAAATAEN